MMAEREISLVDLILDILSHWRGILICMLVGALLMGSFSYVKAYRGVGGGQEEQVVGNMTLEDQIHNLEGQLSELEKIAVYTVMDDEQEYAAYQQYVESSLLMQMNPYSISEIDMIFRIRADDGEQSSMLKTVYENLVNGIGLHQWVEEQTGIPSASTGELIIAQQSPKVLLLIEGQGASLGSDCLKVIVIHYDEAECERLAQCVKDYIDQQYDLLSQELGVHEVVLLSESAGFVMDTEIRDAQLSYSNRIITLLTSCARAKDAFTDNQQIYYELLKAGEGASEEASGLEEETEPTIARPSISVKYVALGAVLFAFIYAGVLFVLYILNGKLRANDDLQGLYNISQLGLIVKDDGKKRFFIDRWIDALRNWNRRRFTREQSLELAVAAIKIAVGKQGLDIIYLMGCDLKAGADAVCNELKERLEKEKITVKILDNVLYDAETMEELERAEGVVLIEKAMSTMYDEIRRELELAYRQDIKVLGGIVME